MIGGVANPLQPELDAKQSMTVALDASGDIFDKVKIFCMSSGFEREFESFAERHVERFMGTLDMQPGDEQSLEYHTVYQEYLSEFEGKIVEFIAEAGSSVEEFHRLSQQVLALDADEDDFDPTRRFFIEALLATTEYDIFMGLMKEEAKKHRDNASSRRK